MRSGKKAVDNISDSWYNDNISNLIIRMEGGETHGITGNARPNAFGEGTDGYTRLPRSGVPSVQHGWLSGCQARQADTRPGRQLRGLVTGA